MSTVKEMPTSVMVEQILILKDTIRVLKSSINKIRKEDAYNAPISSAYRKATIENISKVMKSLKRLSVVGIVKEEDLEILQRVSDNNFTKVQYRDAVEIFYDILPGVLELTGAYLVKELESRGIPAEVMLSTKNKGMKLEAKQLGIKVDMTGYEEEGQELSSEEEVEEDISNPIQEVLSTPTEPAVDEDIGGIIIEDQNNPGIIIAPKPKAKLNTLKDIDFALSKSDWSDNNLSEEEWISIFVDLLNDLADIVNSEHLVYGSNAYLRVCTIIIQVNEVIHQCSTISKFFSKADEYVIRSVRNNICHLVYKDGSTVSEIFAAVGTILKVANTMRKGK